MKKKIARLQRWLDRFSAACDNSRWDSAIAEADCLSAEVRDLREDLCDLLNNQGKAKNKVFSLNAFEMSIKSIGIALFIVLASTIPIAVEAEKPLTAAAVNVAANKNSEHLSWVTQEEDELLAVLRSDLSGKNKSFSMAAKNFTGPSNTVASAVKKNKKKTETPVLNAAVHGKSDIGVTAEDLLALIQIGEKALRGGDPAIKVIN